MKQHCNQKFSKLLTNQELPNQKASFFPACAHWWSWFHQTLATCRLGRNSLAGLLHWSLWASLVLRFKPASPGRLPNSWKPSVSKIYSATLPRKMGAGHLLSKILLFWRMTIRKLGGALWTLQKFRAWNIFISATLVSWETYQLQWHYLQIQPKITWGKNPQ